MRSPMPVDQAKTAPFDTHHERYERWFDTHQAVYISELLLEKTPAHDDSRGQESPKPD
jgi:hypothetical protein